MFEHKFHILVVDDDSRLRSLLTKYLRDNDFLVTTAKDGDTALKQLETYKFDILIIDIMMPGISGLDLTKQIRKTSNVPIIMLTAMGEIDDRITGLEIGADDYLPKPFEPKELILRIHNVLKRIPKKEKTPEFIKLGKCQYNLKKGELTKDGEKIHITPAEKTLLKTLGSKPGEIFSREDLAEILGSEQSPRSIDVQITRLRKKIELDIKNPSSLQTVRGKGYMLIPD